MKILDENNALAFHELHTKKTAAHSCDEQNGVIKNRFCSSHTVNARLGFEIGFHFHQKTTKGEGGDVSLNYRPWAVEVFRRYSVTDPVGFCCYELANSNRSSLPSGQANMNRVPRDFDRTVCCENPCVFCFFFQCRILDYSYIQRWRDSSDCSYEQNMSCFSSL